MKAIVKFLMCIACIALVSCSTEVVKQDATAQPPSEQAATGEHNDGRQPKPVVIKDGKTLKLVRVMDGGACKNELEGAKGVFLVYAELSEIERIKREKGEKIFTEFGTKIQLLSEQALRQAVNTTNFAEDPFALGDDEARQKLAGQLSGNFTKALIEPIDAFVQETGLTIDVTAFPPSLVFFQKGCDATFFEDSDNGNVI